MWHIKNKWKLSFYCAIRMNVITLTSDGNTLMKWRVLSTKQNKNTHTIHKIIVKGDLTHGIYGMCMCVCVVCVFDCNANGSAKYSLYTRLSKLT